MSEGLPVPDAVTVAMRRGLERCRRLPAQPFDIWVPQVSTDVGGLVRDGRLEVFLLADDGNQLVGCVRVQSEDPLGTGWGMEVKHSFRRMGYRLAQAALEPPLPVKPLPTHDFWFHKISDVRRQRWELRVCVDSLPSELSGEKGVI